MQKRYVSIFDSTQFESLKVVINRSQKNQTELSGLNRFENIYDVLNVAINFFIGVGFAIAIVGASYAMILLVMTFGEKDNIAKARDAFFWSVVAAVLSILVLAIKRITFKAIGVSDDFNL